ncbi:Prostaglandin reductase 2 [Bulinus truncatus]|nr:Prostaglandin reductase 2 [Bulinus truncatus]
MARYYARVVLKNQPGEDNEPTEENFLFEEILYPTESLKDREVLIQNLYLSMDPALRCRMNSESGVEYMKAWEVGETIHGVGGIGKVIATADPDFVVGDLVSSTAEWPWQLYFIFPSNGVRKIPAEIISISPRFCLSVFGITGLTAYFGVKDKAHIIKGANQTMVVSAAAGSTGSLAGQIAKAEGCGRVVGICGSDDKCEWVTSQLGFEAAINYKTESVTEKLHEYCPKGIDIYFDNVGGAISDEVIKQMNQDSHIVLCGQIDKYNKNVPYPPPLSEEILAALKTKNITRDRFLVLNYHQQFEESIKKLLELYLSGKIKVEESIESGLQNAGRAFISMMKGGNKGKQLVQVSENISSVTV